MRTAQMYTQWDFNPRSPHGERPVAHTRRSLQVCISIHAPRTGSDREHPFPRLNVVISIHAPRTGSDLVNPLEDNGRVLISIHAPRTGSDRPPALPPAERTSYFNPRSPHGERPMKMLKPYTKMRLFQSTLPARGATNPDADLQAQKEISIHAPRTGSDWKSSSARRIQKNFNPRSPHGERLARLWVQLSARSISIHAPRTGSDRNTIWIFSYDFIISIHAPRTGSDITSAVFGNRRSDFNPRSPHGERLLRGSYRSYVMDFNPRSPHGERPDCISRANIVVYFNPRSPHGERRHRSKRRSCKAKHFNPRSPHGERLRNLALRSGFEIISIHAPRTGSDIADSAKQRAARNFNPRSPHGERRERHSRYYRRAGISIHAPRTGSDGKSCYCCGTA